MSTPSRIPAATAFATCCLSLLVSGGCVASKTAALQDGLRPTNFSGTREKSLYEMTVSNEVTRLRKGDPALSQKEAMARATTSISSADYGQSETPQEQKARKLKEAQQEFAADLEKSMAR